MKLTYFKTSALALASFAFVATSAQAASLTYNDGDLYLGFDETGVSNDVVVDLGQVSQFSITEAKTTVPTGTIVNDLDSGTTFGANWDSVTSTLLWGAAAANSNTDEVWATKAGATPWLESNDQSNAFNSVENIGGAGSTIDANGAAIQATSGGASWAAYESTANGGTGANSPTGSLQEYFQPGIMTGIGSKLYLDALVEGTSNPGTELGYFTINSGGTISFTGANAPVSTPEPSTYALMILGGAMMLGWKFRRRNV